MAGRSGLVVAALLVLSGCARLSGPAPTPSPIPAGTTPQEALLGRPVDEADCFTTSFPMLLVPDSRTMERHVHTVIRRPAWLPSRGFLGTVPELTAAVGGRLIASDPQTAWVLVPGSDGARADRYFPLTVRDGSRIWYRDTSIAICT